MRILILAAASLLAAGAIFAAETYGPYRATVMRVIDGDTVEVQIALWPGLMETVSVRLAGVNAPELHTGPDCEREAGRKAREFTRQFLERAGIVIVEDVRLDKYGGRVIGRILADGKDLSDALLKANLARPYAGGKRESWC